MIGKHAVAAALIGLAALPGCASIISGNETTVDIRPLPEAARCELKGDDFESVVDAPASVVVPSSATPISVTCDADGFKPGIETNHALLDGWIFANLLFGYYGVIGGVVDGLRGAGLHFPTEIEVVMEPEKFASAEERDAFYDGWRDRIEALWADWLAKLDYRCRTSGVMERAECDMLRERLNSRRAALLAIIEGKRNSAVVEVAEPLTQLDAAPR
jgi:hypothetical protein